MKYLYKIGIIILLTITTISLAEIKFNQISDPKSSMPGLKDSLIFQSDTSRIPSVIKSPSCIGEVSFPHEYHIDDLEFDCEDCHHETNAVELHMPHEDYFKDYWIDCGICHHKGGQTKLEAQACSKCHHTRPTGIADETLSAKVVIHKSCWECHDIDTGEEASQNCEFCHSGPKTNCW